MFLLKLITILGVAITFTETPAIDCGAHEGFRTLGCYKVQEKVIVLSYDNSNLNHTLWHEIGHAIFLEDDFSRIIIEGYPTINNYPKHYTNRQIANEKVANYFAEFMLDKNGFSIIHPCLWLYFDKKLNNLTN